MSKVLMGANLAGTSTTRERVENMRISNKEKICDYYII